MNHQIDNAIPALTDIMRRTGATQELDFPGGLLVRVTPKQATIFAHNPDGSMLDALENSGRSFCVTRTYW
jgi:hypothetical protein